MTGRRLILYDATCRGRRALPGLSHAWSTGSWLYRRLGGIDAAYGATSWAEGLDWLIAAGQGAPIAEVQYWGHGRWGRALVADDVLDANALAPGHPLHARLLALRERLVPGDALWWWRTCETYGATIGQRFAEAWTRFLGCTTAGHTFVIGLWQSGLHVLRPGETPAWAADEGLRRGTPDAPEVARQSWPGAPSTITCFTGSLPG